MSQLLLISAPIIVFLGAFFLTILSLYKKVATSTFITISTTILVVALIVEIINFSGVYSYLPYTDIFNNSLVFDTFSNFFTILLIFGTIFIVLITHRSLEEFKYFKGEYFALLLFSLFGMMMLSHSNELFTAYISLEIASFAIYILIGFKKTKIQSEAVLKYLVFSSFIGIFFLLGAILVYAVVGSTNMNDIVAFIANKPFEELKLLFIALSLMLFLFLFKIAAFPFQGWVLDVYKGAPTHITAFMASVFKIAIFSFFLRLFLENQNILEPYWDNILYLIIVLTILYGSWLAIVQDNVEIMLVASSIVHTGYILMGLIAIGQSDAAAYSIMFYLIAYLLSAVVSFGVVSIVVTELKTKPLLDNFNGLAKKRPFMSAAITIALLSLAGVPSTIGFIAKFYIFTQIVHAGYWPLALFGVLATFVSIYYYFRVIARIYFYDRKESQHFVHLQLGSYAILFATFLIILGGVGSALVYFIPSINIDAIMNLSEIAIKSI
ncbi:MAG: NADH-quinone oxidoreductase subunit N [Campylobacterota bacterium]|nr:NADH-quinone oxidoreductase subunit N [Campylobacterota bacterium]